MGTFFWNSFNGKWDAGSSWLGNVAPGPGDTAVVAHGTLTNSSPDLTGLTIVGQNIAVVAMNQFTLGGTTLDVDTVLTLNDADGAALAASGSNALQGTVAINQPTDLYLIPGTTAVVSNSGQILIGANTRVLGFGTLENTGEIVIGNLGLGPMGFEVVGSSAALINSGTIVVNGSLGETAADTTARFGFGGGSGTIQAARAEVTFTGGITGGSFEFLDAEAVLRLDVDTASFGATIRGFRAGNRIELGVGAADGLEYTPTGAESGTLAITNGGTLLATLFLEGSYATGSFALAPYGGGDVALTTAEGAPCFAEGTVLRTRRGEVAVEALRVGDVLPTRLGGESARVVWTGWRRVDCRRHPRPGEVMPVRVRRGAVAPGVPRRDVVLSPDHALFVEGVLVPVRHLVNGATILRQEVAAVTYWHVELERHDVIEASGLAVESYLDTGNRGGFSNGPLPRVLHPEFGRAVWATHGCAPLHVDGALVAQARERLLARARRLGFVASREAGLRLSVDGRRVEALVDGEAWLVPLPRGAKRLRLRSAAGVPAEMAARGGDVRRLGVAVAAPAWDGVAAGLEDARFLSGWHAPEEGWRWTDGDAVLDVRGLADVGFRLVRAGEHWRRVA